MNKKFSTLVAVLLAAGAWTTLDAKIVKIESPVIGGSYVIGTTVTEGDDNTGTVAGYLIPASGFSSNATGPIAAFGNEWTLVKTDKANQFLLKSGANYLLAESNGSTLSVGTALADAVIFELKDGKLVAIETGNGNTALADNGLELTLGANNAIATLTAGGTKVGFAIYSKDELTLSGFGGQTVPSQTSIVDGEYYFISGDGTNALKGDAVGAVTAVVATGITEGNVEEYLWKVTSSVGADKIQRYKFINKKTGLEANILGVVEFVADTKYNGVVRLATGTNAATQSLAANLTAGSTAAPFTLYKSAITALDGEELNKLLSGGFNLSIKLAKDSKDAVEDASAFDGKLTAVKTDANEILDATATQFRIKSGKKFLVLNTKKGATNLPDVGGIFELVDDPTAEAEYLSVFELGHYSGTSSNVVSTIKVGGASMADARTAYIITADGKNFLRTKKTITADDVLPYVTTSASEIAEYKTFLGKYMNISFISDDLEEAKDIVYKKNGVLANAQYGAAATASADYVDKSTVLLSAPEAQWAVTEVTDADNNKFTLINRESGEKVTGVSFRKTAVANEYIVETVTAPNFGFGNDRVKISFVENTTKFDGFRKATPNELRNQVFNIGQYHNETGNTAGYWAENHQSNASHQLGVIADEAAATVWSLKLDNKLKDGNELTEVDTVFIVTKMAILKDDKLAEKLDTLAVLPYQIQNKGNLEYVRFEGGKNLEYYVCNEVANTRVDDRFALKLKPNGTVNIVTLADRANASRANALGDKKVYVGNSNKWGSLKQLDTYKPDDNSLMVVTEIDRPEYRKVVKEWGDTVRIYRDEYPTEVLFEKRDDKSVVEKDTLSFLNVNNSITGANPALFVDTAYVNRVDADGVKNTCYQYLLAVGVKNGDEYHCPLTPEHNTQEWKDQYNNGKPCPDALTHKAVKGRFLINLVDTAFAYKQEHLHNNPYVNNMEAYEHLAKLSFVEGIHADDTLYITRKGGEVVKLAMDTAAFNVAKFAFRYVDNEKGSFKIQTRWKDYAGSTTLEELEDNANDNGYLRWVNGTIVVTNNYLHGETFNMEEGYNGNPTANENAPKVAGISVVATNGGVIVKGAEGKNVVITNVLGQTIANTTISSSEATIAAPAGVVVVAVEGEAAVKAIVK